jgi:23S rRNA (adenine2503-C2)-methyltransferase
MNTINDTNFSAITTTPQTSPKQAFKGLTLAELEDVMRSFGEPVYRARQIFRRLYEPASRVESFAAMTELPIALRERLEAAAELAMLTPTRIQESADGTKKFLFELADGRAIETVLIPSETIGDDGEPKRLTLCVSTQVGCAINCKFCATASLKMKRNLTTGEIVDQLLQAQKFSDKPITNLVFMGMGEPMLNYDNVMKAVEIFTHDTGGEPMLLGAKRITLSTSGLVEGIKRMADERRPIKLALSLHATTNGLRTELMPINKKWNLAALGDALEYYYRATKQPVTYEYILFDGLNDGEDDARRLAKLTRRIPSKVNVIPFHPISFTNPHGLAAELTPPSPEKFAWFIECLRKLDVTVMIRSSSGKDIHAACGQLALSDVANAARATV